MATFWSALCLRNINAMDGLGMKDPQLADEFACIDIVNFEPNVLARKKQNAAGCDMIKGQRSDGVQQKIVLKFRGDLILEELARSASVLHQVGHEETIRAPSPGLAYLPSS